jgi:deglycase
VAADRGLVTSCNADDIPAFNSKMIEEIARGVHAGAIMADHQTIRTGL